jgi:hypothetical protein
VIVNMHGRTTINIQLHIKVKTSNLEQATEAQKGSSGTAALFL